MNLYPWFMVNRSISEYPGIWNGCGCWYNITVESRASAHSRVSTFQGVHVYNFLIAHAGQNRKLYLSMHPWALAYPGTLL